MESVEEQAAKPIFKKKKKLRAIVIDPNQLTPHAIGLVSHLYESYHDESTEYTSHAEFAARSKFFKKVYKVTYINPNNSNQIIEQPVKLTDDIDVYPTVELNPVNLTPSQLEWLTYLHRHHPGQNHFMAGQPYIAAIPDFGTPRKLLQRPFILTKDLILRDLIEINPSDLTEKTKNLLHALLKNNPEQSFFDANDFITHQPKKYLLPIFDSAHPNQVVYQIIRLSQSLLRYARKLRKNNLDRSENDKYRYAVYTPKPIGEGIEGIGYLSDSTIKLIPKDTDETEVLFKQKTKGKYRFIKLLTLPRDENNNIKRQENGELYDDRKQSKKALREWDFLKKLSIFAVKNPIFTNDDTRAALMMRYAEGRALIHYMIDEDSQNIFTVDQRLDISIMIGEAILDQVHQHGIIHRDIKPDNMILKTDDHNNPTSLIIVDFGLAKWNFEENIEESRGTKIYKSPEAFNGEKTTEKSDAYNFAKTLELFWEDYSDDRYNDLDRKHWFNIQQSISKGLEIEISQRATIFEIISIFKNIKNERHPVNNPSLHM